MFIQNVIGALEKHKIRYALVGGHAVALHGAVRGTVDIDIVIAFRKNSLKAAEVALQELGLKSRLPITATEVYKFRKEYIQNRNLTAWSFINLNNPLEIVDILITEDLNNLKTVTKKAFGINIKVAAIPDLIAIKKKAGRPQDIEDIKALEKLL
jgi:predicted nucleotidyltransferase